MGASHPTNTLAITTFILPFKSDRLIIVLRVEKSKNWKQMERICQQHQILRDSRTWWIQPVPRRFLRIQSSSKRTSDFCNLPTLRSLTSSRLALQKALSHLETSVREIELAAFINWGHMAFYRTSKPWKCYWELNSPNSFQEHRRTCIYKPSFMVIYETQATEMLQGIELTSLFSGAQLQLPKLWLEHKPQLHLPLPSHNANSTCTGSPLTTIPL